MPSIHVTPSPSGRAPLVTAASLALAATGGHAALITSSGPITVPSGDPISVPGSVVSNIGGIGLQVQNFFAPASAANVYLGISSGTLHKNALAAGTDVGSLAFDFPFNGQTLLTLATRGYDGVAGAWEAPTNGNGFVEGLAHNYYGFQFNSGAGTRYGWIDVQASFDGTTGYNVIVNGWAYEDSGASLTVPSGVTAAPEPGSLALAAAGLALAGAASRRRRQQQRQAA